MKLNIFFRRSHFWISLTIVLPIIVVVISGLLLQLKKELNWVQPATQAGEQALALTTSPLTLTQILSIAKSVPEAGINKWQDIERLDIRPAKGLIKVRAHSSWEIQIDAHNGKILQTALRRSELIESIHDGSFFHEKARLWLFLPAACGLLVLSLTGLYMLIITFRNKYRSKIKRANQTA
ncbi:PepSY domain-containing protein [Aliikangiella marina]|uniref:PepSY domain-containing protein n=1 Tax=Aliikangiella marina TaxID=1712262 RepID=A0A545T6T7_9GAMM|nr:PepSY domain-containing protein [Aliikangiella marina]TQV72936.1 PepSY domain-containing protein [Aliikangiella marina]